MDKQLIVNPVPMSLSNLDLIKEAYLITPNLVEAEALAGLTGKENNK